MRKIFALPILILLLSTKVSAQSQQTFSVRGLTNAGVGAQFYIDFVPALIGPVPTGNPDPGDIRVIVPPFFAKLTPNQAIENLALLFNKEFRGNVLPGGSQNYSCALPPTVISGEPGYTGTLVFETPIPIVDVLSSLSDALPAGTSTTGGQSISWNPTILDNQIAINRSNPQGFNSVLRINGLDPTTNPFQTVELPLPSVLNLTFESGSNTNQPYTLFRGDTFVPGAIPTFLFDTIDVFESSLTGMPLPALIVVDGICVEPLTYNTGQNGVATLSVPLSPIGSSARAAIQAAITDPTGTPFNIDLTAAADLQFADGQEMPLNINQDGSIEVPFVLGSTFDFYGATYTSVFVHENGFVTFGQATSLPSGGKIIDPLTALGLEPAIFGMHGDWAGFAAVSGSKIFYREVGGVVRIKWGTPSLPISHEGVGDMGNFEIALALQSAQLTASQEGTTTPGNIFLSYGDLTPGTEAADFDNLIGILPGSSLSLLTDSLDFGEVFNATNAFDAILSQDAIFPPTSHLSIRGVAAAVSPPAYANGLALANRQFVLGTPGAPAAGYILRATNSKPDGITGVVPNAISVSALPLNIDIVGQFKHLTPIGGAAPQVFLEVIDFSSVQLPIVGVQDPLSLTAPLLPGFRLNEGLTVTVPASIPFGAGFTCDIRVDFGDGSSYFLPSAITITP
ncbi:MAG: hypothetical protein ACI97A_002366 [Planctomycetota bacterium]|jgi:hypothetical protein